MSNFSKVEGGDVVDLKARQTQVHVSCDLGGSVM